MPENSDLTDFLKLNGFVAKEPDLGDDCVEWVKNKTIAVLLTSEFGVFAIQKSQDYSIICDFEIKTKDDLIKVISLSSHLRRYFPVLE